MFLKNYTSEVPVSQTIYRIEQILIRCGAAEISKEYEGTAGKVRALLFKIQLNGSAPLQIRLPADEEAATETLFRDYAGIDRILADGSVDSPRKKKTRKDFIEQGSRTAWKIVEDWVSVQMSMIQMKQAETLQVFLPYIWDGKRSYYQALKVSGFRGLLPEKTE